MAVDDKKSVVIIELKRGSHKLQLLQSLTYAAMISTREPAWIENLVPSANRDRYNTFIASCEDEAALNENQRIILIAESFEYQVLATAQWLTESYGVNITCHQVALAREAEEGFEYLSAVQVFPLRPLAEQARIRGALRSERANRFPEIEELLPACTNQSVITFYSNPPTNRRNKRGDALVFPNIGKMRFRVRPMKNYARVHQLGRFEGDEAFWREKLSSTVFRGHESYAHFRLVKDEDFAVFTEFARVGIATVVWTSALPDGEEMGED